ncbi:hypothetical protein V1277_003578 [Bradyrhizobium sp. AZCC 1588]|uniref:hypothetical protein n=1 Tax=unclassified Bradyrhizobium TaxID=2631580 RepID=UPI002FF00C78
MSVIVLSFVSAEWAGWPTIEKSGAPIDYLRGQGFRFLAIMNLADAVLTYFRRSIGLGPAPDLA